MYLMKEAKHLACQADIAVADICKTALVLTCLWAGVTIAVLPPGQVSIGDSSLFTTVRDRVRKTHLKPKASAGVSSQASGEQRAVARTRKVASLDVTQGGRPLRQYEESVERIDRPATAITTSLCSVHRQSSAVATE